MNLDLGDQVVARDYVDFGIFTCKVTNGPNGTNVTTWDIDISERSDYPNSRECTFQKFWQAEGSFRISSTSYQSAEAF